MQCMHMTVNMNSANQLSLTPKRNTICVFRVILAVRWLADLVMTIFFQTWQSHLPSLLKTNNQNSSILLHTKEMCLMYKTFTSR